MSAAVASHEPSPDPLPSALADANPKLRRVASLCRGYNIDGNVVVKGENLAVLHALVDDLDGAVRCIYIDPPYNNSEQYAHYDDRWQHQDWLNQLRERIHVLHRILRDDGSLWMSIDDSEVHYLRIIGEEIFGRENFVATVIWNHRRSRENRKTFSNNHEYILCFAKDFRRFRQTRNLLPATEEILARYGNPDHDPRGPWQSVSATAQAGHATKAQYYTLVAPSGAEFEPPKGRCWVYSKPRMDHEIAQNRVYFGKGGTAVPRLKRFLSEARLGVTPETLWMAGDVGTTEASKKHALSLIPNDAVFETPKPESLIERILSIATNPGDLVVDPYLGSGTTAAVAMKMGRPFLGIESGEHVETHAIARLSRVVAGEQGGVSELHNWDGGSGFSVFALT